MKGVKVQPGKQTNKDQDVWKWVPNGRWLTSNREQGMKLSFKSAHSDSPLSNPFTGSSFCSSLPPYQSQKLCPTKQHAEFCSYGRKGYSFMPTSQCPPRRGQRGRPKQRGCIGERRELDPRQRHRPQCVIHLGCGKGRSHSETSRADRQTVSRE